MILLNYQTIGWKKQQQTKAIRSERKQHIKCLLQTNAIITTIIIMSVILVQRIANLSQFRVKI